MTDGGPTLAERLGHGPDARLLIVNCDDLGSSHAANLGCYDALRNGIATSSTLMVPCPWAREASARYQGEDVGVHLTLNAEWDLYRWGPITRAPSLHDGDGGFPRTIEDLWEHADLDEVRRELTAQIERAILWGFDISHLDCHMGSLSFRPEFFDIHLDLAVEERRRLGEGAPAVEVPLGVEREVDAHVLTAVAAGRLTGPRARHGQAGAGGDALAEGPVAAHVGGVAGAELEGGHDEEAGVGAATEAFGEGRHGAARYPAATWGPPQAPHSPRPAVRASAAAAAMAAVRVTLGGYVAAAA